MKQSFSMVIESLGVYLPSKEVTTGEILQGCVSKIPLLFEHYTGVCSRRVAGDTEFAIDLATNAIADCFSNSRYGPADIDMLISCNICRYDRPDNTYSFDPTTSIMLKKRFGFVNALTFDVSNACAGMFTGIKIIEAYLRAGAIRRGMIVSGEYITHLIDTAQKEIQGFQDQRLACLTLGDAGASIILEPSANTQHGFQVIDIYTLGCYSSLCVAKPSGREHGGVIMLTDSSRMAASMIQNAASHTQHVLQGCDRAPEEIKYFIPHQIAHKVIQDAAKELNRLYQRNVCHPGNVIDNLAERGNTASTSHFVALNDMLDMGRLSTGDTVLFSVNASGLTIGTVVYTFGQLPRCLEPRKSSRPQESTGGKCAAIFRRSAFRVEVESVGIGQDVVMTRADTLEMACDAAANCLISSRYSKDDIGLLIFAGVYRSDFIMEPAIASLIAGRLQINASVPPSAERKSLAFDVFNGSMGFLNACHLAIQMLETQEFNTAMIISAEVNNNAHVRPSTRLGIKETASAVILRQDIDGRGGFGAFVFRYFDEYIDAFAAYARQHKGETFIDVERKADTDALLLECIPDVVGEFLRAEGLELSGIKIILPPQISSRFISLLAETLEVDRDRCIDIACEDDLYTSSLPYVFQYVLERGMTQPGDIGLVIAAGHGIQVACATYYF